jgi:hypothetical protein
MVMYRLPAAALAALALAVGAAGCGASALGSAEADTEPAAAPSVASSDAGWSAPSAPAGGLTEDFATGTALQRWGYVEGDYGRNRFRVRAGRLEVFPPSSAWVDGHRAFFLYRKVRGDFDVSARLRVAGDAARSGLLVRAAPVEGGDREDWLSLATGVVAGRPVVERRSTARSRSRTAQLGGRRGWTQLRVVRSGARFTLLSRRGAGVWQRRWSVARPDLPATVQVGVDTVSGGRPEVRAQVDWVRFAAPAE